MKRILIALLILSLVGCATVTYESKDGTKVQYTTFVRKVKASVKVSADQAEATFNAGVDPVATESFIKAIELGMQLTSKPIISP